MPDAVAVSLALQGIIDPVLADRASLITHASGRYRGVVDGLEVGLFVHQFPEYAAALEREEVRTALGVFSHNTLHLVVRRGVAVDESVLRDAVALAGELYASGLIRHLSVHYDMHRWFGAIQAAAPAAMPLLFENMDANSRHGITPQECADLIAEHPRWGMVLDVAHALETRDGKDTGPETFLATLGGAIRQMHVSWPGNLYDPGQMGEGFATRHSMVHLDTGNAAVIGSVLRGGPVDLVTVEGVVPPGEAGEAMVSREVELFRAFATQGSGRA